MAISLHAGMRCPRQEKNKPHSFVAFVRSSLFFTPVRYPDDRQDALPNQPRGNSADDFLAGIPRSVAPNETLAGFPHRTAMVYRHGWRIPAPPRLPVYD